MNRKLNEFLTGDEPTITVEGDGKTWKHILVQYGDYKAIINVMGVGEGDGAHLCIDVYPFVGDDLARASVFGMEAGRRIDGFTAEQAEGTSHGLPGAPLVAVLVGKQG